jgi:ABC-type sugar transport system ATPase subunit
MTLPALTVRALRKAFTLHLQGGTRIPVLDGLDLDLRPGECLVLTGPSGAGKSTVLKLLYGSYRPLGGSIRLRHDGDTVELVGASPRLVLAVRRRTLGYVSQFLRVVPRVSALDIVAEPMLVAGIAPEAAREHAAQARAFAQELGEAMGQAPLHAHAQALRLAGDYDTAAELFEQSLALNRRIGDHGMVIVELHNLGHVEIRRGNVEAAAAYFAQLPRSDTALTALNDAAVTLGRGERERARELLERVPADELPADDLRELEWLRERLACAAH